MAGSSPRNSFTAWVSRLALWKVKWADWRLHRARRLWIGAHQRNGRDRGSRESASIGRPEDVGGRPARAATARERGCLRSVLGLLAGARGSARVAADGRAVPNVPPSRARREMSVSHPPRLRADLLRKMPRHDRWIPKNANPRRRPLAWNHSRRQNRDLSLSMSRCGGRNDGDQSHVGTFARTHHWRRRADRACLTGRPSRGIGPPGAAGGFDAPAQRVPSQRTARFWLPLSAAPAGSRRPGSTRPSRRQVGERMGWNAASRARGVPRRRFGRSLRRAHPRAADPHSTPSGSSGIRAPCHTATTQTTFSRTW
jgi:hypothetical protein